MTTKILPLDRFTWNKYKKALSAEHSDFKDIIGDTVPDELMVESHHTGKMVLFRGWKKGFNREGDVQYWKYWAPDKKITLILYND